jgi:hypothetical protein
MSTTKQIVRIDASSLSKSGCTLRWYYDVVKGYSAPGAMDVSLHYGICFHYFVHLLKTLTCDNKDVEALRLTRERWRKSPVSYAREKKWMDESHLMLTCITYADRQQEWETVCDKQGKRMAELKFSIPLVQNEKVEILLCGTIDDLCKRQNGCYAIRDYKTTGHRISPANNVAHYFSRYALSCQLLTYCFAVEWYAKTYSDSVFADFLRVGYGCFIEGVFLSSSSKTVFETSDVYFFSEELKNEYRQLLYHKAAQLASYIEQDITPIREGVLTGECIYCKYKVPCGAKDENTRKFLLSNNFNIKQYDPLNFHDE